MAYRRESPKSIKGVTCCSKTGLDADGGPAVGIVDAVGVALGPNDGAADGPVLTDGTLDGSADGWREGLEDDEGRDDVDGTSDAAVSDPLRNQTRHLVLVTPREVKFVFRLDRTETNGE